MGCCADKKDKCCGISKVVIPAALGGHDGEYAPQNGAYQNTLVYYEASGVSYLYANDGSFERLADGVVATIEVGETTTLTPGSDATVTNRGTKYHALLDFGIPQGEKGDTGTAATISVGTTTTGAPGTNASVTNSGTSSAAVFDLTIPRGDTGATGQAATIAVGETTTLAPGSSATVTNSGTSSAAVFDFGIPKGDTGDTGPEGTVKSEYVTELPAVGDSDTFYLMSKSTNPTGTVQGNPVSINNTQTAGQVTDFELQGDTSQVTLTGKNKFNGGTWRTVYTWSGYPEPPADGNVTIDASDANSVKYSTTTTYRGVESDFIAVANGQTFTLSFNLVNAPNRLWVTQYDSNKTRVGTLNANSHSLGTTTVTTTQDGFITVAFGSTAAGTNYEVDSIQLELGASATSYESFCGGTQSPSPSYPQDINVVTGTQTIDINGTSYPISLGNIWLAKIGTYQDRIYTDGTDWFIEKKVGKVVLDGTENWSDSWQRIDHTDMIHIQSRFYGQLYRKHDHKH